VSNMPHFPLVHLELEDDNHNPTSATAHQVTSALRDSGFLVIRTPILPLRLQRRALKSTSQFLASSSNSNVVTHHPSDPKTYAMLEGVNSIPESTLMNKDLKEWYEALRVTRDVLLRAIAMGLDMMSSSSSSDNNDALDHSPDYFVNLHNENNDAMRLLNYPPADENTGNRCKEHSDYGTLTLLLTDGVGGLEAYVDGAWRAVPYVEGGVVVNIGSILSEWTRQELKATLHRVAGPASVGISSVSKEDLVGAVARARTSIAYFADPNGDVSTALKQGQMREDGDDDASKGEVEDGNGMSVSDYIRWRSGGEGEARSGVAFTSTEESRLENGGGETR